MAAAKKPGRKRTSKKAMVVSKKVKDYSNDPYFVKKAKAMQAVLKRHGLPDSLAN